MFDTENPHDGHRALFWHAESYSLFESTDPTLIAQFRERPELREVTGEEKWETRFAEQRGG
jgi:hypothetical protein